MPAMVLLGPQRLKPTLAAAVEAAGVRGLLALVTAGWEEREEETAELEAHLGRPVVNLRVHARTEEAFRADPEFAVAYRRRRERLRELQDFYRVRLAHLVAATEDLGKLRGEPGLLGPERDAAMEEVRALDARQLVRIEEVHREFEEEVEFADRPSLVPHRREIARALEGCEGACIAGGHVALLLNRMRLFGLGPLLRGRAVFAWSAGAMAAGEAVVIFHDSPPEGPGHPEVLGRGLGLFHGVLPLPHAKRRLRLDDAPRLARFALRFVPAACLAMDDGSSLRWDGRAWTGATEGVRRIGVDGTLDPVPARLVPEGASA